jgi:hypothetical protein
MGLTYENQLSWYKTKSRFDNKLFLAVMERRTTFEQGVVRVDVDAISEQNFSDASSSGIA